MYRNRLHSVSREYRAGLKSFSEEEIMTGIQKKQRLLTMIFGAFAIFFTGYPHVWSIYQPYVMEQAGWSQGQASMCFYLEHLCIRKYHRRKDAEPL